MKMLSSGLYNFQGEKREKFRTHLIECEKCFFDSSYIFVTKFERCFAVQNFFFNHEINKAKNFFYVHTSPLRFHINYGKPFWENFHFKQKKFSALYYIKRVYFYFADIYFVFIYFFIHKKWILCNFLFPWQNWNIQVNYNFIILSSAYIHPKIHLFCKFIYRKET